MSNHPMHPDDPQCVPAVGDEYDGNPIIEEAVRSIWAFAPGAEHTITRDQAAGVLRWWQHHHELSERELRQAVGGWASGPWSLRSRTANSWPIPSMATDAQGCGEDEQRSIGEHSA